MNGGLRLAESYGISIRAGMQPLRQGVRGPPDQERLRMRRAVTGEVRFGVDRGSLGEGGPPEGYRQHVAVRTCFACGAG